MDQIFIGSHTGGRDETAAYIILAEPGFEKRVSNGKFRVVKGNRNTMDHAVNKRVKGISFIPFIDQLQDRMIHGIQDDVVFAGIQIAG